VDAAAGISVVAVVIDIEPIRERFSAGAPFLDERGRRLVAAAEAFSARYEGITAVAMATGVAPPAFRWPRWVPRYRLTVVSGPPAGPPPLAIAAVGPPRSLYIVYPGPLTVFTPQPREAGGGAEFQRSRLLLPCHI